MLHNKTIAVVVPAYNEETQIAEVINTMPDFYRDSQKSPKQDFLSASTYIGFQPLAFSY